MQKISFEDTTVVKSPYVIIDGVEHEVYNGTYQGGTDLNAQTFNQMQDNIESAIDSIANLICPIGKVEVFFDNNDHSNYLGFTWERTSIGRVPVGIDSSDTDFDTIGETGGEKINSELHCGSVTWGLTNNTPGYMDRTIVRANPISQTHEEISAEISNLQPYQVMAFWKRVS